MWSIARVDYKLGKTESPFLNSLGLFGIVWASRKKDLPAFQEIRQNSGFCCPSDDLVLIGPDGHIRVIDEADEEILPHD